MEPEKKAADWENQFQESAEVAEENQFQESAEVEEENQFQESAEVEEENQFQESAEVEEENQFQESAEVEENQRKGATDSDSGISSASSSLTPQTPVYGLADDVFPHATLNSEEIMSELRFKGTNRGCLSVQQDGLAWDLTIAHKPYYFKKSFPVKDDYSILRLVAPENVCYSKKAESPFLCGNKDSYTVDMNASPTKNSALWRSWSYPILFSNCCSPEAQCKDCKHDKRVVLQYWGDGCQYDPCHSNGALFFVIEGGGDNPYQFCLRPKNCARCFGAFVWD